MQRFTFTHLLRVLACAALLAPAAGVATAAELGDVTARSFIGQPLSADIELVSLAPEEVNALQVRLARPDVFRGANITMNPALSSVRMSVVKRDQKQFLHVTTTRPVDAEYVHVYVELSAVGRQDVRLATVWLQADPNPPPPPAPVATAVPMPAAMTSADAERIAAQARAERAAALPAASAAPPVRDRSRPAPLPSVHESEIGVPGALKAAAAAAPPRQASPVAVRDLPSRIAEAMGTPRAAPAPAPASAPAVPTPTSTLASVATTASASAPATAKPAAKRDAAAADGAVPLPVAQALLPLGPLPLPAGVKRAATPAACAPSGISAKECKALDTHSLALSSKLVELEGKMKALQGAIKNSAPAASAPAAAAPTAASKAGQAGTVVLAAAGSSVAAAVATPASAKDAPKSASAASAARAPESGPEAASAKAAEGKSSKPGKAGEAQAATMDGASASASAAAGAASASASADGQGASASASAAGASASAPVPLKRVLPKLKYKKEKPAERPTNYVAWGAGVAGALLLAGAGLIYWRRRKSGAAPLKIWQGFRRKKPAEPADKPQEAKPLHEVTPESIMQ